MNGGQVNPADVVNAASDVLRDIENGSLRPAEVEARGDDADAHAGRSSQWSGDSLWELHCDVTRQALALGASTSAEIREWASVAERREAGLPGA